MRAPGRSAGRRLAVATALCCLSLGTAAMAAERDICENKSGPELIRCIEAAARGSSPQAPKTAPEAAPGQRVPSAAPGARQTVPAPPAPAPAATPSEDCTGRSGDALRRCLAAGGRLSESAATVGNDAAAPAPKAPAIPVQSCDAKSGEALRTCIEASARGAKEPAAAAQPQAIACTGYIAADQSLCVHRNMAIAECRNKRKYPDRDVCLRSLMISAPEPTRADCGLLQARARSHCEARNQVFQACGGDKMGYFACLQRQLGADALLMRR
jgi:hypothetical protein